jgi:hypothetical protein
VLGLSSSWFSLLLFDGGRCGWQACFGSQERVLERELREAFNCGVTNAGGPDVGAIGRFGSWGTPVGSFGVSLGVAG